MAKKKLPRYWKVKIHEITGLNFCDRYCGCGENNQLWWFPVGTGSFCFTPEWLPAWMNGSSTESIWEWLVKNGKIKD
jgi:hypothetical protein